MKQYKLIFIALLSLLLFASACKDKKVRPKNILSKKEFVSILTDIHLTEAMMEKKGIQGDSLVMYSKANLQSILANHHTDKKLLDATYAFYIQNPDDLDLVYLEVIDKLSQMQADANK